MKKLLKVFGITVIAAVIVFSMAGCDPEGVKSITITGLGGFIVDGPNYQAIKAEIYNSHEYETSIADSGNWTNIELNSVTLNLGSLDEGIYYVKLIKKENITLAGQETVYYCKKLVSFKENKPTIAFKDFGKYPIFIEPPVELEIEGDKYTVNANDLYEFKNNTHSIVSDGTYNGNYTNWYGYYSPASGDKTISSWFDNVSKVEVTNNKITIDLSVPEKAFNNFLDEPNVKGLIISEFNNDNYIIDLSKNGFTRIVFIWVDQDVNGKINYQKGKTKFDNVELKEGWNKVELSIATNGSASYKNISDADITSNYKWTVWE